MDEIMTNAAEPAVATAENAAAEAEVVASPEEAAPTGSAEENAAAEQNPSEGGERAPAQNRHTNAYYKGRRQKAEQQAKEKQELKSDFENQVRESDLFKELEARAERDREEAALFRASRAIQKEIETIRAIDPRVQSLEDIGGNEYLELIGNGMNSADAYCLIKGRELLSQGVVSHAAYKELQATAGRNKADAELYRATNAMQADLAAIQAVDPSVQSLEELGEAYADLFRSGVSGVTAYYAIKGREALEKAAMPPSTGKVGGMGLDLSKREFTSDELDRLEYGDLMENNGLFQRAMNSMKKIKNKI